MDEGVHSVVGDEHQDELHRVLRLLVVVPRGEGLHVAPHGLAEVPQRLALLRAGRGLQAADVALQGELDVHVQVQTARQQEGEIGPGAGGGGLLLPVVHPLLQARRPQDVVRHPLPPLAPGLAVAEDAVQLLGRVEQVFLLCGRVPKILGQPFVLGGPFLLQVGHQPAQAGEVLAHLGRDPAPLLVEQLPFVFAQGPRLLEIGLHLLMLGGLNRRGGGLGAAGPDRDDQGRRQPDRRQDEGENSDWFHAGHDTKRV